MQLRKEAWKKFRTLTEFEPVTSPFTCAMLYQLSYEATDVGRRSIVGSYVPVKEMSVNDICNKSYVNCGNELKTQCQWLHSSVKKKPVSQFKKKYTVSDTLCKG